MNEEKCIEEILKHEKVLNKNIEYEIADFSYRNLSSLRAAHVNLKGAKFTWANMNEIKFEDADLSKGIFTGAYLKNARFRGVNLRGADFHKANLEGAIFQNCNLSSTNLRNANLTGVVFDGCLLNYSILETANLTGIKFIQTELFRVYGNYIEISLMGESIYYFYKENLIVKDTFNGTIEDFELFIAESENVKSFKIAIKGLKKLAKAMMEE